jgi:methylglyoxal synthase
MTRPRPRIAFITTKEFRQQPRTEQQLREFVYEDLGFLCLHFDVLSTGRTWSKVGEIVAGPLPDRYAGSVAEFLRAPSLEEHDLQRWRNLFQPPRFSRLPESVEGMIEIAYELVEGRLDAVLHLTDWSQVAGKPPAMVVRRQANVHDVYMAADYTSVRSAVRKWRMLVAGNKPIFREKPPVSPSPIEGLSGNVLALIAHDAKKLDMCHFVVEHARQIMQFDFILTTGTTGNHVKRFLIAAQQSPQEVERKVRLCHSGPYGGDVQIAAAVVRGTCNKVIFLQDPMSSHAHETDIHLFEQAVLLFREAALKVDFELAFNVESARMLL